MSPADLRRIRRDLDMSQADLARALGYAGPRIIRHYEGGTKQMPPLFVRLLAMIDRYGMPKDVFGG